MTEPCSHFQFASHVTVTRVTDQDYGPVVGYAATLRVQCADCGLPFTFKGLPGGYSPNRPRASALAHEARLPLAPVPLEGRAEFEAAVEAGDAAQDDFRRNG